MMTKSRQATRRSPMPEAPAPGKAPFGSFSFTAYDGTLFRAFEIEPHEFKVFVWHPITEWSGEFSPWGSVTALMTTQAAAIVRDRHHEATCQLETIEV